MAIRIIFQIFIMLCFFPASGFGQSPTINLSEEESIFINNHPVIKVANELDWPPFDYNEFGKPKGLAIDYIKLLAKKAGLQIEFIHGPSWDELLQLFEQKQIDIIPALYKNQQRQSFTLFTTPYYKGKLGVYEYHTDTFTPHTPKLLNKRVGIQKNHGAIPIITAQLPGIKLIEIVSPETLVKMLGTQKLDAIIGNPLLFDHFAKENQISQLHLSHYIEMSSAEQLKTSLHVGVRNDYPLLHQILNKAIQTVSTGEMSELEKRWRYIPSQPSQPLINLTPEERAFLNKKGPIQLCIDPNWMPYEQINDTGVHEGISADYFKLFSQRLSIQIKLHPTQNWSETLKAAKNHLCDLVSLATPNADRKSYLNFTTPLLSFPYVIATKNNKLFIDDFEQELNKTFSVVRDYSIISDLRMKYPQLNLTEVNSSLEGLKMVQQDEVYGFIDAAASIASSMQQNNIVDIKIAGQLPLSFKLGIASRKDEPLLQTIFQKAVDSLTEEEKKRTYNKWMAVNVKKVQDYTLLWQVLVIASLILLAFLYWNRKLNLAMHRTENALFELEGAKQLLEQQNKQLEQLSITDHLTQIYNRTKLDEVLAKELHRAKRHNTSFGVIMLDVDFFKQVNDSYGHQTGDQVLIEVASTLKNNIRSVDTLGRWGGEEFLIICPEANKDGLVVLAEHLRKCIENHIFTLVYHKTASFGLSLYQPEDSAESLVARADQAMYIAKTNGRNKISII